MIPRNMRRAKASEAVSRSLLNRDPRSGASFAGNLRLTCSLQPLDAMIASLVRVSDGKSRQARDSHVAQRERRRLHGVNAEASEAGGERALVEVNADEARAGERV